MEKSLFANFVNAARSSYSDDALPLLHNIRKISGLLFEIFINKVTVHAVLALFPRTPKISLGQQVGFFDAKFPSLWWQQKHQAPIRGELQSWNNICRLILCLLETLRKDSCTLFNVWERVRQRGSLKTETALDCMYSPTGSGFIAHTQRINKNTILQYTLYHHFSLDRFYCINVTKIQTTQTIQCNLIQLTQLVQCTTHLVQKGSLELFWKFIRFGEGWLPLILLC